MASPAPSMPELSRTDTIEIPNDDDGDAPDPFTGTIEAIFKSAVEDFKATHPAQCEIFAGKGINIVKRRIIAIQSQQERQRAMLNFARIQSYLERFAEFDTFCKSANIGGEASDELSEFIWGPTAYILQRSQEDATVLDFVLEAYERFGQRIPAVGGCSDLLNQHPGMTKCIAFMYHDLLQFSKTLVRLLTGQGWKKRFQASWKDYDHSFDILLKSFDSHGRLLKNLLDDLLRNVAHDTRRQLNDHIMRTQDNHSEAMAQQSQIGQDLRQNLQVTRDMHQLLGDHIMNSQDQHDYIRVHLQRHIDQYVQDRVELLSKAKKDERRRKEENRLSVLTWMSTPGVPQSEYHAEFKKTRADNPDTGLWILDEDKMSNWMNEEIPTHSMLWLNGKKGAGKTVLTSLIVDKCKEVEGFKTSYFYCREDDNNKNTCMSILKGILRQMVTHNEELLPSCYEKRMRGEERLNDLATIKYLLDLFCEYEMNQFIIIDGLDECQPADIKPLVQYWAAVVEKCDNSRPGKIRVLLVSQDLNEIRRLMQSADILDLPPEQSQSDISRYVSRQFTGLQRDYELTDDETQRSREIVCFRSQGMFLYAVLTMENLLAQGTTGHVKEEIKANRLPENLEKAYTKIIERLRNTLGPRQWDLAKRIFGWLAGAKRPLQWHEIQAALSIKLDDKPGEDAIDFHNNRLRKDIREICGSLVQVLGNRIEFIHSTTRSHIIKSELLDEKVIEYDLTVLCLRYLTLPCFHPEITDENIRHYAREGWYAFQDYAISKWKHHLENLVKIASPLFTEHEKKAEHKERFGTILKAFLDFHQGSIATAAQEKKTTGPRRTLKLAAAQVGSPPSLLSPPNSQQSSAGSRSPTPLAPLTHTQPDTIDPSLFCQPFLNIPFYHDLVALWTHVCKHQTSDFKARNRVSLPQLATLLEKIRNMLGTLATESRKDEELRKLYGKNFYKCERITCDYFHEGFDTKGALEKHSNRHDRPFQCPVPGCSIASFGFSHNKDRDKHIRQYHPDDESAGPSQFVVGDPNEVGGKKTAVAKWECHLCPRKFTRQANLKAHVDNHFGTRSHACETCGKMFTRSYDRNRHRKIHVRRPGPVVRG